MGTELLQNTEKEFIKRERLRRMILEDRRRSQEGIFTAFDRLLEVSARPFDRPVPGLGTSEVEPLIVGMSVSFDGIIYLAAAFGGIERHVSADLHADGIFREIDRPQRCVRLLPLETIMLGIEQPADL
jgi:hypothetical protein